MAGSAGPSSHILSAVRSPSHAHPPSYHAHLVSKSDPRRLVKLQSSLVDWFDSVQHEREMPWRKEILPGTVMTEQEKGQRGYEVWVSEIMLQQTQVATVRGYFSRWIKRFPTVHDLAKADIEQVNEYWQGLGYYSRASRLLAGAKTVVKRYGGILPDDPKVLEQEIDGIGPYSAGAICSIAYGKSVPMIDGNVHRVLSRLVALHAPQTAKPTLTFLWALAAKLVPKERAGAWNQGLMELGATVCTPKNAKCGECPVNSLCAAYQEVQAQRTASKASTKADSDDSDIEDLCSLCSPFDPAATAKEGVSRYPMAKERKKQREAEVAVCVLEWMPVDGEEDEAMTLVVKRPAKGLLAGLWELPSVDLPADNDSTPSSRSSALLDLINSLLEDPLSSLSPRKASSLVRSSSRVSPVPHVFSHIKANYLGQRVVLVSESPPALADPAPKPRKAADGKMQDGAAEAGQTRWIRSTQVDKANMGLPHKKVFKASRESGSSDDSEEERKPKRRKKA